MSIAEVLKNLSLSECRMPLLFLLVRSVGVTGLSLSASSQEECGVDDVDTDTALSWAGFSAADVFCAEMVSTEIGGSSFDSKGWTLLSATSARRFFSFSS